MRAFISVVLGLWLVAVFSPPPSWAAPKKKGKETAEATESGGGGGGAKDVNACGCYKEADGTCRCSKKSKCGCPGDCEPAGCEEKRQKEMEREVQEEIKRQKDAQQKRDAELKKRQEEQEAKEAEGKGKKR
jgi:hypothetical protein